MIRIAIIIFLILVAALPAFGSDSVLDTYYELGRRGASGLVEEEDLTDEFDYIKYTVKLSQKINALASYNVKYQYYYKDYDNLENIDNIFNHGGLGLDAILYSKDGLSMKLSPDLALKKKIYQDSKNLDYNQIKFDLPLTLRKEDDWTFNLSGGINYYEYPDAPKDEFKINSKLEVLKKFFDSRLEISAFYKIQYIIREKIANRFEKTYGCGAEYKLEHPLIRSVEAGFVEGMNNTKIYEDREDAYDFKYLDWHIKTTHTISETVKTSLRYTDLNRTYADFSHNYGGFLIENKWDWRALKRGDYTLDLNFNYLHKQFRYPYVSSPFSLHLNAIAPEIELKKKNDWKAYAAPEIKFYDFPAKRINDKKYYIIKVTLEKYLLKKDLAIGFDYKYTYKNYLHKPMINENIYRFRANYKF